MRHLRLVLPLVVAFGAASAPAAHATRYAAPDSTRLDPCTQALPCKLTAAIGTAADGETVLLAPGEYLVGTGLTPSGAVHMRGDADLPRPRIVGSSRLSTTLLGFKNGGSLRHLHLEATGPGDALTLSSGVAEGLVIASAAGDGAKVTGSPTTTVLRDSIVRTRSTTSDTAALKLRDGSKGGDIALVNVTAIATAGDADGVLCETTVGQTRIVNTILRGGATDIDVSNAARCATSRSNISSVRNAGTYSAIANTSDDPKFADAAAGNFRPLAGAPGTDAGDADALLGTRDLDGRLRTLGSAPDMGAYELDAVDPPSASDPTEFPPAPVDAISGNVPVDEEPVAEKPVAKEPAPEETPRKDPAPTTTTPAPSPETPPAGDPVTPLPVEPAVTPPALGRTVVLEPTRGTVLVRLPGSAQAIPLDAAASLPVGTVIDATRGAVTLTSALDAGGRTQTGTFHGGAFEARQARVGGGMVDIVLRGGTFAGCRRPAARTAARGPVAFAAAGRRRVVRRLWGKDSSGRFRTRGKNSVATVRGTRWLTVDRCDGTLTRVTEGAVEVRDLHTGRKKLVRAGGRHLARRAS